ncbi:MAG TPA: xylulokinase [Actinobacteria bacterium]|nr:xylulose kinase [bacterium BMS3Bbin01]HDH25597.1 xylulokinase [Actinomycetota bacterium]
MPLVAGIDCSTQSTKALLVDGETGHVAAVGRSEHTVVGTDGARETDPEIWWTALEDALAQTGRASQVAAISVAGQQHGLVVLDRNGNPLRPAKLWNDTQSAPDACALIERAGGARWWAEHVGVVPVASFTATKWAWLRRVEPDVAAATRAIRLPHDFLTERLTGRGVTDRSDASGTAWWSTKTGTYSHEVLSMPALQLAPDMLPTVLGPHDRAGEVTRVAAERLGLRAGIPVGPGAGDNAAAAMALGLESGVPVISLGTSGTVFLISESRTVDPSGIVAGFADATGRFLPLAATLNCTVVIDRIAGWLGLDRETVASRTDVVVLPFFDGERTPDLPNAAGSIFGLRHTTNPSEILLAAYQGVVSSLLEALRQIDDRSSGVGADAPLVVIGGGAKGTAWRSVVRSLSGRSVQVPDAQELVALGAAVQATSILTGEPSDSVARRWHTRKGIALPAVTPDEETIDRIRSVRSLALELNTQEL